LVALKKVVEEMDITELEDHAAFIQFQLSNGEDDKMWPFYYKEYSEGEKPMVCFFYL
jgi:hypothetical protein